MSDMKKVKKTALDNKCPGCSAPIHFNPTAGNWKCDYCNSEFTLEEMQKYNNASSEENNVPEKKEQVDNSSDNFVSYKCKNCGAEIIADEQTAATFCVYCGNTAILKSKLSGGFAPDSVIPFKTEKEEAIKAFVNISNGRPFVPKDFNNKENIDKIKGVYIPFWLCDLEIEGAVNCDAKKIKTWTSGDTHYTKTDTYKLYRSGSMTFSKIPVDGSTRFNNDIMNSIEPFDYNDMVKYNHAYLSGFFAEKYDVDYEEASKEAINRALESGKEILLNDSHGYSGKVIFENTLAPKRNTKYYALLPVWMVNVKYNNKMYIFAMNGQTGEFIGDIPLDKMKVAIWSILSFASIFLAIILISIILFLL